MRAIPDGHMSTIKLLIAAGAAVGLKSQHGDTAFTLATEAGNIEIINYLAEADTERQRDAGELSVFV
jgi:ankyrin repeat protein